MSSGDVASELMGLVASLPPGVNAFDYIRQYIDEQVWRRPTGYFLIQDYVFIGLHALVIVFSATGCLLRLRRGSLWIFSVRSGGIYFPNTAVLSQICFALYSLLYISSITSSTLNKPTIVAYGLQLLAYIPLGLAIHFQIWATICARPQSALALGRFGGPKKATSSIFRPSPRVKNAVFIAIAVLFFSSIVIGRGVAISARKSLIDALDQVDDGLEAAKAANASLTSLISLTPTFESYFTAVIAVRKAFAVQSKQLKQSLASFRAVDDIRTQLVFDLPHSSISSPSTIDFAKEKPDLASLDGLELSEPRSRTSSSHHLHPRAPTIAQMEEIKAKLVHLQRVRAVIQIQAFATVFMMCAYGGVLIFYWTPQFSKMSSAAISNSTDTWLGWAFLAPGIASATFFLYASARYSSPKPSPPRLSDHEEEIRLGPFRPSLSETPTSPRPPKVEPELREPTKQTNSSIDTSSSHTAAKWVPSKWAESKGWREDVSSTE
ncbi:hypothetical protein MNV49_000099 [Pseudohyphozyma bogoriensis]|nr:hypothetical protein MNV49_000099 [Pseudohyphozyma bogoriensis]